MQVRQIVIDTNVLVAGLRSKKGGSYKLLQLIGLGHFDINLSVPLIMEYEEVLLRQLPHLSLEAADVRDLLDYYCAIGNQHEIFYLWRPTLRDPSDEMLLELAVKAQCDNIVTFNQRDFQGIDQFGLVAVTPNEFLREIGSHSQ